MKLQLTHHTRYDYLPAVETAQHMAYLQPLQTAQQQVLSHQLDISPTPASLSRTTDVYGNSRGFFFSANPTPGAGRGGTQRCLYPGQRHATQQRELGGCARTVSLPI